MRTAAEVGQNLITEASDQEVDVHTTEPPQDAASDAGQAAAELITLGAAAKIANRSLERAVVEAVRHRGVPEAVAARATGLSRGRVRRLLGKSR